MTLVTGWVTADKAVLADDWTDAAHTKIHEDWFINSIKDAKTWADAESAHKAVVDELAKAKTAKTKARDAVTKDAKNKDSKVAADKAAYDKLCTAETAADHKVTALEAWLKAAKTPLADRKKKHEEDEKKKKAAAKKKSPSSTKKTVPSKKDMEAHLTALKKTASDAKSDVAATEAKIKSGDCDTTKKDTAACKTLVATLATEKTAETDANTAVTNYEALIKKDHPSSGATIGIIIGCVAGCLCITGGAVWYMKHKKGSEEFDDQYATFLDNE